jgi:hypothetical protein
MILSSLKGNNKKTIRIIAAATTFILICLGVQQFFFQPPSFDEVMRQGAAELNKNCPLLVSQQMKLDKVVASPDNVFSYNYTLLNFEKSEIHADTLKKYIEPCIINEVATNPDMKNLRESKASLTYSYTDKNGVFVLKLLVTPDKYSDR